MLVVICSQYLEFSMSQERYRRRDLNLDFVDKQKESSLNIGSFKKPFDKYVERIFKYLSLHGSTFLVSLIYMDRFFRSGVYPTEYNMHKVFFISVMTASKFWEDICFSTEILARVCGVSSSRLVEMEVEFLNQIDFDIFVSQDEFKSLEKSIF